jgi:hypothetical protein
VRISVQSISFGTGSLQIFFLLVATFGSGRAHNFSSKVVRGSSTIHFALSFIAPVPIMHFLRLRFSFSSGSREHLFYFYIFKIMINVITFASCITIYASPTDILYLFRMGGTVDIRENMCVSFKIAV